MPALPPTRPEERPPSRRGGARWGEDPEVRLMLRVGRGDGEAFAELERRYAGRVFGYFCRQLGDRTEAEDLTQEVFLRLYRARQRYRPRARFATWVFHITQNVARNALRARRRRPAARVSLGPGGEGDALAALLSDRCEAPS